MRTAIGQLGTERISYFNNIVLEGVFTCSLKQEDSILFVSSKNTSARALKKKSYLKMNTRMWFNTQQETTTGCSISTSIFNFLYLSSLNFQHLSPLLFITNPQQNESESWHHGNPPYSATKGMISLQTAW